MKCASVKLQAYGAASVSMMTVGKEDDSGAFFSIGSGWRILSDMEKWGIQLEGGAAVCAPFPQDSRTKSLSPFLCIYLVMPRVWRRMKP